MGKCEGREPLQKGKKRGTRMLEAGTEGYQELVVTMEDTALAAGSGGLRVLATPVMCALMEKLLYALGLVAAAIVLFYFILYLTA